MASLTGLGSGLLSDDMSLTLRSQSYGRAGAAEHPPAAAASSSGSDWASIVVAGLQAAGQIVPAVAGAPQAGERTAKALAQAEAAKFGQLQLQLAAGSPYAMGAAGPNLQTASAGDSGLKWLLIGGAVIGGGLLLGTLFKKKGEAQ